MDTLLFIDELRLDYASGVFGKESSTLLSWRPNTPKNIHLIAIVEPNSWQDFELPEGSQTITPTPYNNTMICILPTKYRNSNAIDDLLTNVFTLDEYLPGVMKKTKKKRSTLAPKGKKQLWISTESYEWDKEKIMPYLIEATQGY